MILQCEFIILIFLYELELDNRKSNLNFLLEMSKVVETRKSMKIVEFAGEYSVSNSHAWKILDFPCFWLSELLKWVVVIVIVVLAVVFGSDIEVNARRPICRHSKCLSYRCGHAWSMFRVCVSYWYYCCWLRRWYKRAKIDMPYVLNFSLYPILEVPFTSVWPMFRACVRGERDYMIFILFF